MYSSPQTTPEVVTEDAETPRALHWCEYGCLGLWGKYFIINTDQNIVV